MVLPVTLYKDPILRKKAQLVTVFDKELKNLVQNMTETMYDKKGVGIAAPQVGKSLQIFTVDKEFTLNESGTFVMINPVLEFPHNDFIIYEEGCLSIPGIFGNVKRYRELILKAYDIHGNFFEIKAQDYLSIVIQHEYDHLMGILFTDKVLAKEKASIDQQLKEFNKND